MSPSPTARRAAGATIARRPIPYPLVTRRLITANAGSHVEMMAPWTAQNAAHRALEISRQTTRFPHSHNRFFYVVRKGERRTRNARTLVKRLA